jgi:hypothetical protein
MKSLERRIAGLERRIVGGEIICHMADGTERRIRGKRLIEMLHEINQGILKRDTQTVLDAVSDNCLETGHGHMGNLLRVRLAAVCSFRESKRPELAASE